MRPLSPVPPAVTKLAAQQEGLLSVHQCHALGVDRRRIQRLVRDGVWRREGNRVVDTDPTPPSTRVRDDYFDHIRRRSAVKGMLVQPGTAAVGAAALALHGVAGLPRHIDPEVSYPRGVRHRGLDGVIVRQYGSFASERYGSWRIAKIEHALAQALPGLSRDHAVAVLSSALNRRKISRAGLVKVRRLLRRRRDAGPALGWIDLADGNDESPAETFARLSCLDHGVPPDRTQVVFHKDGRFLGRCDLGWLLRDGRWLVVEIDGVAPHSTHEALVKDAPRQNRLLATDRIVLLRFKPTDNDRPGGIGAVVAAHITELGGLPHPHPPLPATPIPL
ncbi:hypothetical protein APR04_000470 [Promicromonospora umidemergens]|uniref:DUF559 domain-containing protein n=1 Tax=Promicromonospora umidemergens TaxID=629679 RepID=A0ABP8XAU2_9MICO|nr:type IV toxin-antitoxin system AbiEi family antitoxin domain-containing protein [Promicromonospora umidemergens]MCP2281581.1 hypothetical protein [Promicromonospora umidemergens]